MKPSKLPTLKQDNSYTPYILIAIFIVAMVGAVVWFNYIPNKITPVVQIDRKAEAVLEKTTEIIKRDGGVSDYVARKYTLWIFEASHKHKVDPITILSVMSVESTFKQDAVSNANAIGLMQVIHFWHKEKTTQVGLFDPKNNIDVGTRILREYKKLSRSDSEMLARYNGTWKKSNKYSTKVLARRNKYQHEIMKAVIEV